MKQNGVPKNQYINGEPSSNRENPYKHDVIYSDLGQWKYPGQVTKIPSNRITMQGVNYPVQGVDDTGYSQIMFPGMDYTFPGQYVTEYPMAEYGGDPSLNNLTGHYPFGGQNTKTHTHMQNGGNFDMYIPYGYKGPYPNMGQTFAPEAVTGVDKNLLTRQLYKESGFKPDAKSSAGALGLAQIMPDTAEEAVKKGIIKRKEDVLNPKKAKEVQKYYMDYLYNRPFINKPGVQQNDSVRLAKTLASYNWGPGNVKNLLTDLKRKGIDIYNSYDWLQYLPEESEDYINKILFKKDSKFEKAYNKAVKNFTYEEGGGWLDSEKYKKGGSKRKKGTSKNIQSSINDIMRRNEILYGHAHKGYYDPTSNYQSGGEKSWGEMNAKERAAYLDNKEAEHKSRKQATKEYYKDYVKDSMKKTLEHPMFNMVQYFTPEGMAIGAIKGLVNIGPDITKGDYSAAAFDALTSLPIASPALKYLKKPAGNTFTYKGVVEPFKGHADLAREEANAYYNFVRERQNPYLANQWENIHKDFINKNPLPSNVSKGYIEKPTDSDYLNNFLLNGKPSEGLPYNNKFNKNTQYGKDYSEFKKELNNKLTTLQYGKRPLISKEQLLSNDDIKLQELLGKKPKGDYYKPIDKKRFAKIAKENMDQSEKWNELDFQDKMFPYEKQAFTNDFKQNPYKSLDAYQNLQPNKYGGLNKKKNGGWLDKYDNF